VNITGISMGFSKMSSAFYAMLEQINKTNFKQQRMRLIERVSIVADMVNLNRTAL
jgi:hypothetical protein